MSTHSEPLSFTEKLGYGLGDAASNFFFHVFNLFLLFYYTDVFGIPPELVGAMFLITKVFDAVSDPIMGLIADRTRSRWGNFRPYILYGALPFGVLGWAMFANPELSDSGKLVYAYITYSAMMLAYTVVNVPYSALMGVISNNSLERTKVASYRFVCAQVAILAIGALTTPLVSKLGGGDEALGFQMTMGLFAFISVLLFWVTFATTKERVQVIEENQRISVDLKFLIQNGPWIILFISAILTLMNLAVRAGSTMFYLKYFVGDDGTPVFLNFFDKPSLFMALGTLSFIAGVMCTSALSKRFEKKALLISLSLLNALSMAVFYFITPDQFILMVIVNCIGSFVIGPTPALVWSMYADCADYGEWKTGRRTTALVFSTVQFAQKFGLAVGGGFAGLILAYYGFESGAEQQTEQAINGIRVMFSLIPAALAVGGALVIFFYSIDRALIERMEKELAARRGA